MTKTLKTLKDLDKLEVAVKTFDDICEAESLSFDFDNAIKTIYGLLEDMKGVATNKEHEKLISSHARIDALINESNHFMENADLNASDGYKAYKMHQMLCRKRREIKDAIEQQKVVKAFYHKNKEFINKVTQMKENVLAKSPERERVYEFRNLDMYQEFSVFANLDMEKYDVKIIRKHS